MPYCTHPLCIPSTTFLHKHCSNSPLNPHILHMQMMHTSPPPLGTKAKETQLGKESTIPWASSNVLANCLATKISYEPNEQSYLHPSTSPRMTWHTHYLHSQPHCLSNLATTIPTTNISAQNNHLYKVLIQAIIWCLSSNEIVYHLAHPTLQDLHTEGNTLINLQPQSPISIHCKNSQQFPRPLLFLVVIQIHILIKLHRHSNYCTFNTWLTKSKTSSGPLNLILFFPPLPITCIWHMPPPLLHAH